MTTTKAERYILEKLGAGTTALLSEHLSLPESVPWADAEDAEERDLCLVGAHALRQLPSGEEYVAEALQQLKAGEMPAGVHGVAYAPKASEAFVTIVTPSKITEVLLHGPRASGKTQVVPGALAWLAEGRARAGLDLPLRVLWVHDTLLNAAMKTGRSLEESLWGGLWSLRDGRATAVLTLAGVEMVLADFVGSVDASAAERLRAACHVVVVEEAVASLDDQSGGVPERQYEIALSSSLRMPTPRRVAAVLTNPGGTESWPFRRFLAPGHRADRVAVEVPGNDRQTEAEVAALHETFRDSPDLQARLARGEWADLILGPQVAKGFHAQRHVAKQPIPIFEGMDFWCGWDSAPNAHVHSLIVGQRNGLQRNVLAGLVMEDTGLKQFLLQAVLPWFSRYAPWILSPGGKQWLLHRHDPAMDTYEGGDAELHPLTRIRQALGGNFAPGGTEWPDRAGPMLDLLAEGDGKGGMALQIDPGSHTLLLRQALTSRWHYAQTKGGVVVRDLPYKPNHPWEDLGDAFAYWCGGVAPSVQRKRNRGDRQATKGGTLNLEQLSSLGRRAR